MWRLRCYVIGTIVLSTVCAHAAATARIGLAGKYGDKYIAAVGKLGAEPVLVERAAVGDARVLHSLDLLIVSHFDEAPGREAQAALADWVRDGGKLWLEIAAFPPPAILQAPTISGWAPWVKVAGTDCVLTRQRQAGDRLKYGAWGAGIRTEGAENVTVSARWEPGEEDDFNKQISEGFDDEPAAMLRITHGEGLCLWSGAALWILDPAAAEEAILQLVGAERLPLYRLRELLKTDVSDEKARPWSPSPIVGIFRDPDFPTVAMPAGCDGEFMRAALGRTGLEARIVSADELLSRETFNASEFGTLVLGHGEAFPMEAVDELKRFLAEGGAVLCPAGIPLSHLCEKHDGAWVDLATTDAVRRGIVHLVFSHLLPLSKVFESDRPAVAAVNLAPQWLPDLPAFWPLSGGAVFMMPRGNGLSSHTTERLVAAVDQAGEVIGVPIKFNPYDSRFPRARLLAVGFRGDSHPFNPAAWDSAAAALASCVKLVRRRDHVYIHDLWTDEPLYVDGEPIEIGIRIGGRTDEQIQCKLWIQRRDDGRLVHIETQSAQLTAQEPTDLTWEWRPASFETWAYDIVAEVAVQGDDPPPPVREETAFVVESHDVPQSAREFHIDAQDTPRRGEDAVWLSGANPYSCDSRGIGFFFSETSIPGRHALVDFLDRDLSWIRLAGGNAIRQHYFEYRITPDSFHKRGLPHELRLLDAYNSMAAFHDCVSLCDPFTFMPGRGGQWRERVGEGHPYTADHWLEAEREYYRALAGRCHERGFNNIVWELINEPEARYGDASTAAERREVAENARQWVSQMQEAIAQAGGGAAGIGHSSAPWSPAWDPRGNLHPLPLSNVHHYGQAHLRTTNAIWCPAFGLNYGRPCVVGEFGLPNAGYSRTPFLSDWSASYDRVLHCCLGEQAVGFLNFYLNLGMGNINSPEWGMIRPDYTEKPSGLVWKRWNQLLRFIGPDEFEPATRFIFYNSEQRLKQPNLVQDLYDAYIELLGRGIYARIISDRDLSELLAADAELEAILAPSHIPRSEACEELLDKARATGAEVFTNVVSMLAHCEEEKRIRVTGSLPVGTYVRPLTDGGALVVLVEGAASNGTTEVHAGPHTISLRPPEGRCATLRLDREGLPVLVEAYGPVRLDGETLCDGPNSGYLLASDDGDALTETAAIRVWAEAPYEVEVRGHDPGLGSIDGATITASNDLGDTAQRLASLLADRDIDVTVGDEADEGPQIVLGLAADPKIRNLLDRHGAFRATIGPGKSALHHRSARIDQPWSGAIAYLPESSTVVVTGLTRAGLEVAAMKLAALHQPGTYSVGPFAPIGW